jgi:Leucine-rich repeat (LRR) protein
MQQLELGGNNFTVLPESIGELKNLQQLGLGGNTLSDEEQKRIKKLLPDTSISF